MLSGGWLPRGYNKGDRMKKYSMIIGIYIISLFMGASLYQAVKSRVADNNYVLKNKVMKCFKDVSWDTQTFMLNKEQLTDSNGNKYFYPSTEIKKAMNKLNKLLKETE
jgi:hypothetical protein